MFFWGFVFSFVCYLPVWQGSNPVMACPVPNQASGAFQACQPTSLPGIYLRTDFPDFHQMTRHVRLCFDVVIADVC